jgi:hypothetical protein
MAAQKILRAMNSTQSLSHTGAPIMLVVFLALYYLRPKPLKSLGR